MPGAVVLADALQAGSLCHSRHQGQEGCHCPACHRIQGERLFLFFFSFIFFPFFFVFSSPPSFCFFSLFSSSCCSVSFALLPDDTDVAMSRCRISSLDASMPPDAMLFFFLGLSVLCLRCRSSSFHPPVFCYWSICSPLPALKPFCVGP